MLKNLARVLNTSAFIFLLPFFFVLHGVNDFLFYIPILEAAKLLAVYLGIDVLLVALFYFFYRKKAAAVMAAFITLCFFFFFGFLQDCLKHIAGNSFLVRYSVLISFLFVTYLFILYKVFRSVSKPKVRTYLNVWLLVVILIDVAQIVIKVAKEKPQTFAAACSNCDKPDIYLIVLDGYAGKMQLEKDFEFDNRDFLNALTNLGFRVMSHSFSNYRDTPFSMASLLNMNYLPMENYEYNNSNLNYCYKAISKNLVTSKLIHEGYQVVNNSIFDTEGHPSVSEKTFLISGIDLISSTTLYSRLKRDLYNNFIISCMRSSGLYRDFIFKDKENNDHLYKRLSQTLETYSASPRFVYTHLMMPHFPYYYKEDGELNPLNELGPETMKRPDLYLGYLKYVNSIMIPLMQSIIKKPGKPPIVLLLSDHGYRYTNSKSLYYSNLAAIYLPNKSYSGYYDSLSNVNLFRVLFNDVLREKNALLPDKRLSISD